MPEEKKSWSEIKIDPGKLNVILQFGEQMANYQKEKEKSQGELSSNPQGTYQRESVMGYGYNLLTAPIFHESYLPPQPILDFRGSSGLVNGISSIRTKLKIITEHTKEKVMESFSQEGSLNIKYGLFSGSFKESTEEETVESA